MGLMSAGFLFAALAAALPVAIHLIHRQRYPERPFTTLRFFDKTIKHNTLQTRLIDKILLALRVAALLLVALALARPYGAWNFGEQRRSVVLVLDNSPSMGRGVEHEQLFARAKTAASAVLAELGATDRAALVLTANVPRRDRFARRSEAEAALSLREGRPTSLWVDGPGGRAHSLAELTTDTARLRLALQALPEDTAVELGGMEPAPDGELSAELEAVRERLDGTALSALSGDLAAALGRAKALLAHSTDAGRRIVVCSDMQASEWSAAADLELDGIELAVIPSVPGETGNNLALERIDLERAEAAWGQSVNGTAVVRNYAKRASDAAVLTVIGADRGRPVEIKVPPLAAGQTMHLGFALPVTGRELSMLAIARLNGLSDPFAYDDAWHFQVGVRQPVSALCVNGHPAERPSDRETFYLANALAPRSEGAALEAAADVRECEAGDLGGQQLFQYGTIVLAGVSRLEPAALEKLRQFVNDGGGLLVFPGIDAAPADLNGWGLLPAKVLDVKRASFGYLKDVDTRSAAMAEVKSRAGAELHALSAHTRAFLEPNANARVLARFQDDLPALVEGRTGRGRVVLAAAGCHVTASDWPLRPAFVILVRALVRALGDRQGPLPLALDRHVGFGASMAIPGELAEGTPAAFFHTHSPDGQEQYQPESWLRAQAGVSLPVAWTDGHYSLAVRPGQSAGVLEEPGVGALSVPLSFNRRPGESNLEAWDTKELAQHLPNLGASVIDPAAPAQALASGSASREWGRYVLGFVLALLLFESFLAWRSASEAEQ